MDAVKKVPVIPGRDEVANPESMTTSRGYGFRIASLRSASGMTGSPP